MGSLLRIKELEAQLARRDERIQKLEAALEHSYNVFVSLANRGYYPAELLADEKEFMGIQGIKYICDALGYRPLPPTKD